MLTLCPVFPAVKKSFPRASRHWASDAACFPGIATCCINAAAVDVPEEDDSLDVMQMNDGDWRKEQSKDEVLSFWLPFIRNKRPQNRKQIPQSPTYTAMHRKFKSFRTKRGVFVVLFFTEKPLLMARHTCSSSCLHTLPRRRWEVCMMTLAIQDVIEPCHSSEIDFSDQEWIRVLRTWSRNVTAASEGRPMMTERR